MAWVPVAASVRGQCAGRVLDSSERLYLGGADGVRTCPGSEGSGSQGHVTSVELRWAPADALSAKVFADAGQVRDPGAGGATLNGVGASVAWAGPHRLAARLVLARRIGSNPLALPSGADQDGRLVWNALTATWVAVTITQDGTAAN